jgi:hypothetical protein
VTCSRCTHKLSCHLLATDAWHVLYADIWALVSLWDECLDVDGHYVGIWCVPSAMHVLCIHQSQNDILSKTVIITSFFETSLITVLFYTFIIKYSLFLFVNPYICILWLIPHPVVTSTELWIQGMYVCMYEWQSYQIQRQSTRLK